MKMSLSGFISILILAVFLIGCGKTADNANDNSNLSVNKDQSNNKDSENIPKDNVEEFEKIVNLPIQPDELMWREENTDNQSNINGAASANKKKLTAVMKYSAENTQKLTEQISKGSSSFESDVDAENWFPPELIAKSQESGDGNLKGTSFLAGDFLKEPYTKGKITHINDTDYFILELTSL